MPFQLRGIWISYFAPARVPVQATLSQPVNGTAVAADRIVSALDRDTGSEPHAATSTTTAAATRPPTARTRLSILAVSQATDIPPGNGHACRRPGSVAGVVPGAADADGDVELDGQPVGPAHLGPDQRLDRLPLPRRDLEHQLVVHLQ